MSTDEYVPSETTVRLAYLREKTVGTAHDMEQARAEFDRFLARVRRDAAREALDGLTADVEIDVRLGIEGGDNIRVQDAEAAIDAATIYRDTEYPEETP